MTITWWFVTILGWALFLAWTIKIRQIYIFTKKRHLSLLTDPSEPAAETPFVSVIVPARDEEQTIEQCLTSLLDMDYPAFEVIALNDLRSLDQTGAIMDRLSEQDKRLKVMHLHDAPEDWGGKQYALHIGSQEAQGEYLLLTEADTIFEKRALRLSMSYTVHNRLDHLCLLVKRVTGGYLDGAFMLLHLILYLLVINPLKVASKSKRSYAGLGHFNLVKKSSYFEAGGHEPLRFDIIDDLKLGKLMKRAGFKQDFIIGWDLVHYRWHEGTLGFIKAHEKIAFASMNYSLTRLIFATVFVTAAFLLPYLCLGLFDDHRIWGYLAVILAMHATLGFLGIQRGMGWHLALSWPLLIILFLWTYWRSAFIILRAGGSYWRGTFYPLHLWRAHLYK